MSTTGSEYITPPTLGGANAPTNTTTSAASTAAVAVGGDGFYSFVAGTTPAWIVFGLSGVAAATTANGFLMPASTVMTWKLESGSHTHFRVISSGAGTLSWYKSGP